jgi:hypothetical protein
MTKENSTKNNFVDALAMDVRYAVLTKGNRVQLMVQPKPKELRKRGRRGWHLFGTVNSQADARQVLDQTVNSAINAVEAGHGNAVDGKAKKSKSAKAAAAH